MKNRSPQTVNQKINSIILAMKQNGATTIKEIIDQTGLIYAEVSPLVKQLIKEGKIVKDETGFGLMLVKPDLSEERPIQKQETEQEVLREILKDIKSIDKNTLVIVYSMIKDIIEGRSQDSLYDIASSCGLDITIVMQLNDYILKKRTQKLREKSLKPSQTFDKEDEGRD